ncbi:MAG: toxic anion resistance protein [Defluviitaleaceae bacterium]|nr:toxic anion resistance protein [Defluviitaleaceae bacterium]
MEEIITENNIQKIEEIKKNIDLSHHTFTYYGLSIQNQISKFSDNILQNMLAKENDDVGNDLLKLVDTIQKFDENSSKKNKFFIFKNQKINLDKIISNFYVTQDNIDNIVSSLKSHKIQLLKNMHILENIYNNNEIYFKELNIHILAAEQKLEEYKKIDIEKQRKISNEKNSPSELQKLKNMEDNVANFEKRIHDLKISKTISLQMAAQIKLIQNNNKILIEKIQSSIVNNIPLWKNQIIIALGIHTAQKSLEAYKQVINATNKSILENTEGLKKDIKDNISLEDLKKTNTHLLEIVQDVLKTQKEQIIEQEKIIENHDK